MLKRMVLGSMSLSLFMLAPYGFADQGGKHGPAGTHGKETHMKINGVVSKVQPKYTTIKTSWGSLVITSETSPKNIEVGEEVEMWVNENNTVIDVHRKGDPAHAHRFVTGKLIYVGLMKKEIKLWTPEGEKVFPLDRLETKTGGIEEGALVTAELNEAGTVIDLHRFAVEMNFDEHPHTKSGDHITVNGVVTKIQSGVIYIKSPVGQYTVNAKTAPADAAVGDEVTLWLNEENLVIDHHGKHKNKAGAHRLVTGKLIYAGLTKKEIKLWTPEGEKVFPLERMEVKTKPIEEGSMIVVELDEKGTVIDLRKAE